MQQAREPAAKADLTSSVPYKKLDLTYKKPALVGTEVRVEAVELPAGKTIDLQWGTVAGGWVVEDYYHFKGKKYTETTTTLGKFIVDSNGRLDARFVIPEDYGGVHEVTALVDGRPVAQNGIEVSQSFEMSPASGPIGTPIELRVKGLGWRTMESTWVVNWDNHSVGFVSAAGSRGSAVARFRAAGPVGDHPVKIYSGYQAQSYLNYEQAPNAYLPRPEFTFRTSAGRLYRTIRSTARAENRSANCKCRTGSQPDTGTRWNARAATGRGFRRCSSAPTRVANFRG